MTWDDYNKLFHELELNLVAFKRLMDCDEEVLRLVNFAVAAEREACAKLCDDHMEMWYQTFGEVAARNLGAAIRARGENKMTFMLGLTHETN